MVIVLTAVSCTKEPAVTTTEPINTAITGTPPAISAPTSTPTPGQTLTPTPTKTATPADSTPPTISSVNPAANASGVDISAKVTVLFSESIDQSTLNKNSLVLINGSKPVTGAINL